MGTKPMFLKPTRKLKLNSEDIVTFGVIRMHGIPLDGRRTSISTLGWDRTTVV